MPCFFKCLDIRKSLGRNLDFRKHPYSSRGKDGNGSREETIRNKRKGVELSVGDRAKSGATQALDLSKDQSQ